MELGKDIEGTDCVCHFAPDKFPDARGVRCPICNGWGMVFRLTQQKKKK